MAADLARAKSGKKTKTGMDVNQLEDFSRRQTPREKRAEGIGKHLTQRMR